MKIRAFVSTCLLVFSGAVLAAPRPISLAALQEAIRAHTPEVGAPAARIPTMELSSFLPATFGTGRFERNFVSQLERDEATDTYKASGGADASVRISDHYSGSTTGTLRAELEAAQGLVASLGMAQKQGGLSVRMVQQAGGMVMVEQTQRQSGTRPAETSVVTAYVAGRYEVEVRVFEPGTGEHTLAWARDAVRRTRLDLLAQARHSSQDLAGTVTSAIEDRALRLIAAQTPVRPSGKLSLNALTARLPRQIGDAPCRPASGYGSEDPPGVVCRTLVGDELGTVWVYDASRQSGQWPLCLFEPDDGPSFLYPDGGPVFVPHGAVLLQPARHMTGFSWAFVSGGQLFERAKLAVGGRAVYDVTAPSPAALNRIIAALAARAQ